MSDCCHYCCVRSAFSTFSIWRRGSPPTLYGGETGTTPLHLLNERNVALRRDRCLRLMRFASSSFLRRRRALPHTIPNVDAGPSFPCLLAGKIVKGRHAQLMQPNCSLRRIVVFVARPRLALALPRRARLPFFPRLRRRKGYYELSSPYRWRHQGCFAGAQGLTGTLHQYVDLCSFPFVVAAAGTGGAREAAYLGVRTQTTSAYYWNVNFVQICNGSNSCPRRFTR